jgi:diacylglycerol kinase family enzyme
VSGVPVILNPTAGGGRLLRLRRTVEEAAASCGHEIEWWRTDGPGRAVELAARAAAEDRPLVLAFGGDGTYNEVARGLLGTATAMGALPGGTSSVLAYELGIPRPASIAVTALLEGEDRAMRVGRSDRGDVVLLMLSAGPDSHVLERLRPSFKRIGGRIGVALQAVVEAMSGGPLPRMRVAIGARTIDAGWVIVGKSRCYAGRYCATPGADPFRDDLEVVAQQSCGRRAAASFLLGIPHGRHVRRHDVTREVVDHVRIEPAADGTKVPYQVDGDVVGILPVEVGIDPRSLWVRLPPNVQTLER